MIARNICLTVGAGVVLALTLPSDCSEDARDIGALEAATICGGGVPECGALWETGSVACALGTVLCGSQAELCPTHTHVSLVPIQGTSGEVISTNPSRSCFVCGTTRCSSAKPVKTTKAANCNEPFGS